MSQEASNASESTSHDASCWKGCEDQHDSSLCEVSLEGADDIGFPYAYNVPSAGAATMMASGGTCCGGHVLDAHEPESSLIPMDDTFTRNHGTTHPPDTSFEPGSDKPSPNTAYPVSLRQNISTAQSVKWPSTRRLDEGVDSDESPKKMKPFLDTCTSEVGLSKLSSDDTARVFPSSRSMSPELLSSTH
jgi:hypothetical protein